MGKLTTGKQPASKTGDYSDIAVIDADGNKLAWAEIAKISEKEMEAIKQDVANRIYTFLANMGNELYLDDFSNKGRRKTVNWNEPELIAPEKP